MPLFTIFKTEEKETKIVGQTSKEGFHSQKALVEKITGEKPKSGIITENVSTFNVGDVKIDFIKKDSLGGEVPI